MTEPTEPPHKVRRIEADRDGNELLPLALAEVEERLDALNREVAEEFLKIEKRYAQPRRELYEKRAKAIEQIPGFWLFAVGRLGRSILCPVRTVLSPPVPPSTALGVNVRATSPARAGRHVNYLARPAVLTPTGYRADSLTRLTSTVALCR